MASELKGHSIILPIKVSLLVERNITQPVKTVYGKMSSVVL